MQDSAASIFMVLAAIVLGILVYFLPFFIARGRNKTNKQAIFWLNFFVGWTFVGWIIALVWALTKDAAPAVTIQPAPVPAVLCASCGHYSEPGTKFCGSCGAVINREVIDNPQPSPQHGVETSVETNLATSIDVAAAIRGPAPAAPQQAGAPVIAVADPVPLTITGPKRLVLASLGVFVALLVLFLWGSSGTDKPTESVIPQPEAAHAAAEAATQAVEQAISVSAPKLWADYHANEVAADNQYKGKRLVVRGQVESINKDFADRVYVLFSTFNEFESVHADIESDYQAQAAGLQIGQIITVDCEGGGMVVDAPILRGCSIEPDVPAVQSSPKPRLESEPQTQPAPQAEARKIAPPKATPATAAMPSLQAPTQSLSPPVASLSPEPQSGEPQAPARATSPPNILPTPLPGSGQESPYGSSPSQTSAPSPPQPPAAADQSTLDVTSLREAAEQGGPDAVDAQSRLGTMYHDGQGVPQDYAEAYFWLELATLERERIKGPSSISKAGLLGQSREAASHLSAQQAFQQRERVQKWLADHPPKVP